MNRAADRWWDSPLRPVEKAAYWVETLAKYGGVEHLRVADDHLNFFQYYSLDVVAFLFLVPLGTLWATFKLTNIMRNKYANAR